MSLKERIRQQIHHNGPMDVGSFMTLAVGHYYNSRDPFGADGDFTTAPEISQMFGELIGAWAADCWMQMGSPARFILAECGPGRGTLMADALRATAKVPGFHDAADIHLVEMSEVLKQKQQAALADYKVRWHQEIADLPQSLPLILIANEFLDALPIRQLEYRDGQWQERVIGLGDEGALQFGLVPAPPSLLSGAPKTPAEGDIYEVSPAQAGFVEALSQRPDSVALFIDYGYTEGSGESLQAVRRHQYVPVLAEPGETDLTAHVDFAALAKTANGACLYGPVTQGAFLQRLGIGARAAMLKQNADPAQAEAVDQALLRLTGPDQMGELFKVMAVSDKELKLAGF